MGRAVRTASLQDRCGWGERRPCLSSRRVHSAIDSHAAGSPCFRPSSQPLLHLGRVGEQSSPLMDRVVPTGSRDDAEAHHTGQHPHLERVVGLGVVTGDEGVEAVAGGLGVDEPVESSGAGTLGSSHHVTVFPSDAAGGTGHPRGASFGAARQDPNVWSQSSTDSGVMLRTPAPR